MSARRRNWRAAAAGLAFWLAAAAPASAHPHVWVTVKSEIAFTPDGKVLAVMHDWVFDEMYSSFATQGLAPAGQLVTKAQFAPLAKENAGGLADVGYFTTLKIGGKSMDFDGRYGPLDNLVPNDDDQAPARLGSRGAELTFSHLRLRRDVYYTDPHRHVRDGFGGPPGGNRWEQDAMAYWLGPGEFMMLGDNSPQSKDSRLWDEREYFVSRELMIGKALFIYWPHGLDHLPGTDVWFPLFPNFGRMGFVR